jgi:hypothetical protein
VNDLKDLLELALSDGRAPDPGQRSDPAADLARGRRMLRRRRRRLAGLAGVTAAVLGGVLVPVTLHGSAGHAPAAAVAARPTQSRASTPPAGSGQPHTVALVTWEGAQPPGYRVSEMPKGWVVQGSNPYALVIAPAHDPSTSPDAFVGKLVVMLQSRDATSPPTRGTPQPVNGRPGLFDVQGDTQILTFQIVGGQWVVIQAPVSLGWDSAELAKFASGVQVLVTAQQGRG